VTDPSNWMLKRGEYRIVVDGEGHEVADCSTHVNAIDNAYLISLLPEMLALLRKYDAQGQWPRQYARDIEKLLFKVDHPTDPEQDHG